MRICIHYLLINDYTFHKGGKSCYIKMIVPWGTFRAPEKRPGTGLWTGVLRKRKSWALQKLGISTLYMLSTREDL